MIRSMVRDEFSVQAQLGDRYVPPLFIDYPSGLQGSAFNRVERAVERWPDLLAGVVWDPAKERIAIKSTSSGLKRAAKIAARLAAEGIAEAIIVEQAVDARGIGLGVHGRPLRSLVA